jgi:TRAP-type C4-dicarboxylate transport system substrate-binding protein
MSNAPIKLRWLIAHKPEHLFVRTAEAFAKELDALLPDQFVIEVLNQGKYVAKYGPDPAWPEVNWVPRPIEGLEKPADTGQLIDWNADVRRIHKALFKAMGEQKIHLSQTVITQIGGVYDEYATLDLPFLFDDHDHVSKVLDGEIGDALNSRLAQNTQVRGLAFTYSGGYRIVGSNEPIESLEDLKDLGIATVPTTREFFKSLSGNAKSKIEQSNEELTEFAEKGGAIETTYFRFEGKNVLKTNHSMFLTNIIISNSFFDSLNEEQQNAFRIAAKKVAKLERQWSLDDAEQYEAEADSKGIKISEVTDEETAKMKTAAIQQYKKVFKNIPKSLDLVKKIKSVN